MEQGLLEFGSCYLFWSGPGTYLIWLLGLILGLVRGLIEFVLWDVELCVGPMTLSTLTCFPQGVSDLATKWLPVSQRHGFVPKIQHQGVPLGRGGAISCPWGFVRWVFLMWIWNTSSGIWSRDWKAAAAAVHCCLLEAPAVLGEIPLVKRSVARADTLATELCHSWELQPPLCVRSSPWHARIF